MTSVCLLAVAQLPVLFEMRCPSPSLLYLLSFDLCRLKWEQMFWRIHVHVRTQVRTLNFFGSLISVQSHSHVCNIEQPGMGMGLHRDATAPFCLFVVHAYNFDLISIQLQLRLLSTKLRVPQDYNYLWVQILADFGNSMLAIFQT